MIATEALVTARVLIETSLEIVETSRRDDGGWWLWHDPNNAVYDPGTIRSAGGSWSAFWSDIDAALDLLERNGWLVTNENGLVSVHPKAGAV